jgi:V/A-type H+/Na+-transporting ATPase subunit G/H
MARDDILSKIKSAEADSKAAVQRAMEAKDKKLADATTEAANIVRTAEANAQEYYDKSVTKANSDVSAKKQQIIQGGAKNVDSMRNSASARLDKAVDYLVKEFMGILHA